MKETGRWRRGEGKERGGGGVTGEAEKEKALITFGLYAMLVRFVNR